MTFSSSPVTYPPSSSPAVPQPERKRAAEDLAERQPQPKKRLFGTTLWDAANILRPTAPVAEKAIEVEKPGSKETAPVEESRPRAVFRDPRLQPSSVAASEGLSSGHLESEATPHEVDPAADGNTWSFSRVPTTTEREVLRSRTSSGKQISICRRKPREMKSYERTIAERSVTAPGRATTSYYGIDIHSLLDQAKEIQNKPRVARAPAPPVLPSIEESAEKKKKNKHAMWTEKYRARKFIDLVGDERIHRSVLRWLKGWDSIVFPGSSKPVLKGKAPEDDEHMQRKILLLTGPPGLGKTTLAHVCAKQAGYEVVEINASDERSRDVVKGRIRDCVGTENVRGINSKNGDATVRKSGKPVCVVVDEVDGVVTGSGGSGDGGFMKALIDLIQLDQKNSHWSGDNGVKKGKKGDRFRLLRPMILVCNDVYHPSLRPLRASNLAEIVHVRKAPLDKVVSRLKAVFDREGVASDTDGVRRLCEATWGVSSKRDNEASRSAGEGDLRGVLVVGEWAARKLRASGAERLTRAWVEKNMIADLAASGNGARGIGRGGTKETADRVFLENAGFPKSATAASSSNRSAVNSVSDAARANAMNLLRAAIDSSGEPDRITQDVFSAYPSRPFQDDTFLTKPNAASEWLHFQDALSSRVHSGQEWELAPYLSAPLLGLHHLFGSTNSFNAHASSNPAANTVDHDAEPLPFTGPKADYEAYEALKATRSTLQSVHSNLSVPLFRSFRGPEDLATDLMPYLSRMLAPNVSPVIVGGSGGGPGGSNGGPARGTASVRRAGEKDMVQRAAQAMCATGVSFEKTRVEDTSNRGASAAFVLRMEPPIDTLASFATASLGAEGTSSGSTAVGPVPARYAVRQVLDQEHARAQAAQAAAARQARISGAINGNGNGTDSGDNTPDGNGNGTTPAAAVASADPKALVPAAMPAAVVQQRDFFGRVINSTVGSTTATSTGAAAGNKRAARATIWVTFHEGFSNAVRKPVGLREVMGLF